MRWQGGQTFGGRLLKPNVGRVSVVCAYDSAWALAHSGSEYPCGVTRQALRSNTKHSLSECLTAQVAGYNPPYILLPESGIEFRSLQGKPSFFESRKFFCHRFLNRAAAVGGNMPVNQTIDLC
jgi:hypothetical protein